MLFYRFRTVLIFAIVCLACTGVAPAAETLLDSDFWKSQEPREHQAKGRFQGVLPAGWGDSFVGWNTSRVESEVVTEKGKRFLRFTISNVDKGAGGPVFVTGLSGLVDGGYYRLTVRARNRSTGSLSIGIRMTGKPYQYRYEKQLAPSPEWVKKSWCFNLNNKTGDGLGIFMAPCGVGTVDVAKIRVEKLTAPEEIAAARPAAMPTMPPPRQVW